MNENIDGSLLRFSMSRISRSQYDFYQEDGEKVEFTDQLRSRRRALDVVSNSGLCVISSNTFPPLITLTRQETEILKGFDAVGSRCFSWQSGDLQFGIVGRKPECFIGNFRAFHLYSAQTRVAYWDQPKRVGDIRGIYHPDIPVIQIACVVFGSMYDWDDGGNWLQ